MFGRTLDLVLIARRSRHYAGTRYVLCSDSFGVLTGKVVVLGI